MPQWARFLLMALYLLLLIAGNAIAIVALGFAPKGDHTAARVIVVLAAIFGIAGVGASALYRVAAEVGLAKRDDDDAKPASSA